MQQIDDYDYGPEHAPQPTNLTMKQLNALVKLADELDNEIVGLRTALKSAEKQLQNLLEKDIPRLMRDCGQVECVDAATSLRVKIDTKLWAAVPSVSAINKENDAERRAELVRRRNDALRWLVDNNHESLIRREFTIELEKGDEKKANKLRANLLRYKDPVPFVEGEEVNYNSLSALVRELRKEGVPFPEETLGVFEKTIARVSKAK